MKESAEVQIKMCHEVVTISNINNNDDDGLHNTKIQSSSHNSSNTIKMYISYAKYNNLKTYILECITMYTQCKCKNCFFFFCMYF